MPDPRPPRLLEKLESLGITARDWVRVRDAAERVSRGEMVPALMDLDARYAVAVLRENPRYPPTDQLCVLVMPDGTRVRVNYWKLSDWELYKQGR